MTVQPVGAIHGAYLFTPTPFRDDRGFFSRTMDVAWLEQAGIDPASFAQDSVSRSHRGVIRGMHLRRGSGESKLVRCSRGSIFDVMVDVRADSPTYGATFTIELSEDPPVTVYIPAGCAHGYQALTEPTDVTYRIDRPHDPTEDVTIAWDDPEWAIPWPMPPTSVSARDRQAAAWAQVREGFS